MQWTPAKTRGARLAPVVASAMPVSFWGPEQRLASHVFGAGVIRRTNPDAPGRSQAP